MNQDSALVHAVAPSPNHGDRRGRAIDALILHYTGMSSGDAALDRLRDPASEVSCHYVIREDGRVLQLVSEARRAWHAGRSVWRGERDMNAVSIGIEIVNGGHDWDSPPYPDGQIAATIALCADILARHAIPANRVLAHSDIAPDRKLDPGEWFPWARLASAGIGRWIDPAPITEGPRLREGESGPSVEALQRDLLSFGFALEQTGLFDAPTACAVRAFQRHYRPAQVDGVADRSTLSSLARLLETDRP